MIGEPMKSTKPISIRAVKREARSLYHGHFKTAIKINIVPIIFTILNVITTLMMMYAMIMSFRDLSQMASNASVTSDNDSAFQQVLNIVQSVLSDAIQLIFIWTVSWALIEWYENPKELPTFKDAFQIFNRGNFLHTLLLTIVQSMLIFLWTLLFVVPGIVKLFSYSQTYFAYKVDIENGTRQGQLTDYIKVSRRVMAGRKWELFLLELSFIGWHLLGILTGGIAYIYVVPYLNATRVAYSRHLFTLAMSESVAA